MRPRRNKLVISPADDVHGDAADQESPQPQSSPAKEVSAAQAWGGGPPVSASACLGPLSYHATLDKRDAPAPVLQGALRCAFTVTKSTHCGAVNQDKCEHHGSIAI